MLVVDDEVDLRSAIAEVLEFDGYEVDTAANGEQAMQKLRAGDGVALVLLDLMMPVMDGLEFLDQIRADTSRSWPPVIVLTAAFTGSAEDLGVAAVVRKPFGLDRLFGAIEKVLHNRGDTSD